MSTIRDTVVETMRADARMSGYTSFADPVIAALEAREVAMRESLTSFAVAQGLSAGAAANALSEVGMHAPALAAVSSNGTSVDLSDDSMEEVGAIRHELAGLLERIDRVLG